MLRIQYTTRRSEIDFPSGLILCHRGKGMGQVWFTWHATDRLGVCIDDRDSDTCSATKTTMQNVVRYYATWRAEEPTIKQTNVEVRGVRINRRKKRVSICCTTSVMTSNPYILQWKYSIAIMNAKIIDVSKNRGLLLTNVTTLKLHQLQRSNAIYKGEQRKFNWPGTRERSCRHIQERY